MKKINNKSLLVPLMGAAMALGLTNCTKHDQTLNLATTTPTPVLNTDTVYSIKGTSNLTAIGPVTTPWNGTIGPEWANAPKLTVTATVPDLGNNNFVGYVGNTTNISMRSLYDANNIYWLIEWGADRPYVLSAQWYFNPSTHQWAQEPTAASLTDLNPDGSYRPPFAQDELVMMFNISTPAFNTQSCYALCHVMSSYGGTVTPAGGYMATNGPSERTDVWRWRAFQSLPENQLNDCFIDDGSSIGAGESGTMDKNMVHSDWQVNNGPSASVPASLQSPGKNVAQPWATAPVMAADGGFSNKQSLKLIHKTVIGNITKVNVPIWVIPTAVGTNPYANRNGAIYVADTMTGGAAVKVAAVDSNGVLYSDKLGTVVIFDPNTAASGTAFQQVGSGDGPNCIPGTIVDVYTGSRGDVTTNSFWTGSGWRILIKRALKTNDNVNDADFSSLNDQPFGIGAMFNGADNEHAIVAGLTLHFKK